MGKARGADKLNKNKQAQRQEIDHAACKRCKVRTNHNTPEQSVVIADRGSGVEGGGEEGGGGIRLKGRSRSGG